MRSIYIYIYMHTCNIPTLMWVLHQDNLRLATSIFWKSWTCIKQFVFCDPFDFPFKSYHCAHTYMHACMRTSIHPYIHTSVHPYIHTSIHPYIHTSIHPYIHTSMHPYIHTSMHPYIHASIHPCIHTSIHPCIHTSIHPYIHTYKHTSIHPYIHPYIHAYIHPYIHTSIHPYKHTNIQTYIFQVTAPPRPHPWSRYPSPPVIWGVWRYHGTPSPVWCGWVGRRLNTKYIKEISNGWAVKKT